jgi:hypothetical protein
MLGCPTCSTLSKLLGDVDHVNVFLISRCLAASMVLTHFDVGRNVLACCRTFPALKAAHCSVLPSWSMLATWVSRVLLSHHQQ